MWLSSHGFHCSLSLYLGSVTLALLVQLRTTDGANLAAGDEGDCTLYHLKDGDADSSTTPPIPIAESLAVYLYSESPHWSRFSLGFTDWLDKTTGMLSYQQNAEDASGFLTLTGIEEHGRGEDAVRKYKDEVVEIPREAYHLQHNVWINLTVVVLENKLKVLLADSATIHFTLNAATYNKAFVHIDQSHAISVTFNCIEGTGTNHSSSEIGLVIGITSLIITVLISVAAFYVWKHRRNRQPTINSEKGQGKDNENSKTGVHNDPMENESLLQKAEDEKKDTYSTENEAKSNKAMPDRLSKVTEDNEAITNRKLSPQKQYETSNKTSKHTKKNNIMGEMNLEETKTNQESGGNQILKSSTLPLVYASSIHDERKIRETHKECAQQLLEVDPNEENTTTDMQSNEKFKHSVSNGPHPKLQDISKSPDMYYNFNSTEASAKDTQGRQNQYDGIIVLADNVVDDLEEKPTNEKLHTREMKGTNAYRIANSKNIKTDIRKLEEVSREEGFLILENGNPKCLKNIQKKQNTMGQDTAHFGIVKKADNTKSPESTREVIRGKKTKRKPIGEVSVYIGPPVIEDVFDKAEIERVSGQKKCAINKAKKTTKTSKKTKTLSSKIHPESTSRQCKNTVQDTSTSEIEQSEDFRQIASLIFKVSSKSQKSRETASQPALCDSVAQLGLPKISVSRITRDSNLGVSDQEGRLGLLGQEVNLGLSHKKGTLGLFGQEGKLCLVDHEGNQGLSEEIQPTQAHKQSENVQVLLSNITHKQDTYYTNIQQRRVKAQPSTEKKTIILREGLKTPSNKSKEAMNCESGRSLSSKENNERQDHCDNRYPNNETHKHLAHACKRLTKGLAFATNYHDHPQAEHLAAPCTELESATKVNIVKAFNLKSRNRHFIHESSTCFNFHRKLYKIPSIKQLHRTRGGTLPLYIPIGKRKKARESSIKYLIHLNKSEWIGKTPTKLNKEEFCLKRMNQFFSHKSSNWKNKHLTRNKTYRATRDTLRVCNLVRMRNTRLKKSGFRGLSKVLKINLKKRSCIHISPSWKNKRFHRTLHKTFTRKSPNSYNVDLLPMFNRLNMGKKETILHYLILQNRIRYLLQNKTRFLIKNRILNLLRNIIPHLLLLNKSNSYQNTLRKRNIRSKSPWLMPMKEMAVENDSAMEVSRITVEMEFSETSCKGLPSSDEEML